MEFTVKSHVVPWGPEYTEACVALGLENAEGVQDGYRQQLGEELHAAAFPCWREAAEAALRDTGARGIVLLREDRVEAFCAYRHSGAVSSISCCEGNSVETLEELLRYLIDDMKGQGVTHCSVNCDTDPVNSTLKAALEAVGFEKNIPHVRYFQKLKERPVLPVTDVQVVPSREEHIADCVEIALKLWAGIHDSYISCIGEEIHDVTHAGWQDTLRGNIAAQQRREGSLVALLDGKVVGFCGCRVENGTLGIIGYNGVAPEYRGRGIARYLYEAAFDQFRAQGIQYARVFTGGENGHGPARRAYEKAGYDKRLLNATYYKIL